MKLKIMIVDDNPANLKLAGDLLELEGYEVIRCIDAEKAQEVLSQNHPALILMDVALPGMDGLELTRILKEDAKTKDIKIIALTAFAMKGDKEKVISAGCDGYITKPINTRQFAQQVKEFLNEELTEENNNPVILLVDDNITSLKLLKAVYDTEGYETLTALNGVEALELLAKQKADLIVTDVLMPYMDGYYLCYEIRSNEKLKDIPIIIYTATYTSLGEEAVAKEMGADLFIRKPAPKHLLISSVKEILGSPIKPQRKVVSEPKSAQIMHQYSAELIGQLERRSIELEEAKERLEVTLKRFELAQQIAHFGHAMIDLKTGKTIWSDEMYRILGYELYSLEPSLEIFLSHLHIEDRERFTSAMNHSLKTFTPFSISCRLPQIDGSLRHIFLRREYEFDKTGNALRACATIQDITELVEKEERLKEVNETLELTLNRFSQAQKIAHLGHGESNLITGKTIWSEEAYSILGLEPYSIEPSADTFLKYVHPEDMENVRTIFSKSRQTLSPFSFNCRIVQVNGNLRHLFFRGGFEFDKSGTPLRIYGTTMDVTELVEKEEKLERTNETLELTLNRFNKAQQIAHLGHWELDLEAEKITWSEEVYNILGLEPYSLEPSTESFLNYVHPDDKEVARTTIAQSRTTFNSYSYNPRIIRPNGDLRHLFVKGEYEFDRSGRAVRVYGAMLDVTELVEKEEKLKEVNEELELTLYRFSHAQKVAHLGHWELNLKTQKVIWSDEAFRILGLEVNSIEPSLDAFIECIHPEDLNYFNEVVDQARQTFSTYSLSHRIVHPNGNLRHLFTTGEFEFDKSGNPIRFYGTILDVTELTEKEKKLKQVNEELELFIYKSSHDLKGPIATLQGLISLAKMELTEEDVLQYIDNIEVVTHKLKTTIAQLLKIMHLRKRKRTIGTINMEELLDEVKESFKYMSNYNKVKFNLINKQSVPIKNDRDLLFTVLSNLVENAIKYQKEGMDKPEINIKIITDTGGGTTLIEVTDNGIGIPEAAKDKIFDMFYRATEKSEGAGLGLYLVKNAIDRVNGSIEVVSEHGVGSSFKIILPSELEEA